MISKEIKSNVNKWGESSLSKVFEEITSLENFVNKYRKIHEQKYRRPITSTATVTE